MRTNVVKQLLKSGKPSVGTWLSLCNPMASRFLARSGFHWLTVDMEHSPCNWETASEIFGAVADAGCIPLCRVPCGSLDHIKRALDGGAFGIVVPMVMDRASAEACVSFAKYPPVGRRSLGGALHALNFGAPPAEYYAKMNDEVLVVLQCEHIEAARHADEIFSVPGIDAIFVGPNDLSASMRTADGKDPGPDEYEPVVDGILAACRRHGVAAGMHCFSATDVKRRIEQGWQFLALGSDLALMNQATRQELATLQLAPVKELAKY